MGKTHEPMVVALSLAKAGIRVFPCRDKRPVLKHPVEDATTDADQIATWWGMDFPGAQVGYYPGQSGLVVVDIDEKNGVSGSASLRDAKLELPRTMTYATPSGGEHRVYATLREDITGRNGLVPGVDIRAGNYYAIWHGAPLTTPRASVAAAPTWALIAAGGKVRGASGDIDSWVARTITGKPTKAVRKAEALVARKGTSHDDMLAAVTAIVRLGGERGAGQAALRMRAAYAADWPGYERHWDAALEGSIAQFPLPVTLELSKVERHAIKARNAGPATLPLGDGDAVLSEVRAQIARFVALPTEYHEVAVTLWAAHTHLITSFDSTPRLYLSSPEPGSGKTRALEVLARLVTDPVETMNTSVAFLARRIDAGDRPPTILHDEVDTLFGVRARDATAEELRGIYNSGHRRGAKYNRAATRGKEVVLEEFETFAPVAMAGLGELPDTIRTRSIVVPMRRRSRAETVEPYRERVSGRELEGTRDRLAAWARTAANRIGAPWPVMPDGIADRDADVWEALLAVADAAGGEWPQLARDAALVLVRDAHDRPSSLGIRLLADVRRVLDAAGADRMPSMQLLHELVGIDGSPWGDLGGRGPIDSRFLGRTFDSYGITAAHSIRFDPSVGVAKGWDRRDFADAWLRYVPDADHLTTLSTTPNKEKKQ